MRRCRAKTYREKGAGVLGLLAMAKNDEHRRRLVKWRRTCALVLVVVGCSLGARAIGGEEPKGVAAKQYFTRLCGSLTPFADTAQELGQVLAHTGLEPRSRIEKHLLEVALDRMAKVSTRMVLRLSALDAKAEQERFHVTPVTNAFSEVAASDRMWAEHLRQRGVAAPSRILPGRSAVEAALQPLVVVARRLEVFRNYPNWRTAEVETQACRRLFGARRFAPTARQ